MRPQSVRFHLLDNAIDFATEALTNAVAAGKKPERWKFAIFSLVQAIELSLKEALKREHPALIWESVDNPDPKNRGMTVGIDRAKNRLERHTSVHLRPQEHTDLEFAKGIRNQIVHYEIDVQVVDLQPVFSRLLAFLNDFHRNHLGTPLESRIDGTLWRKAMTIREHGKEIYDRAIRRLNSLGLDIDKDVMRCPICRWPAMPIEGQHEGSCFVCQWFEEIERCDSCNVVLNGLDDVHTIHQTTYCYECYCAKTDEGDHWDHVKRDLG